MKLELLCVCLLVVALSDSRKPLPSTSQTNTLAKLLPGRFKQSGPLYERVRNVYNGRIVKRPFAVVLPKDENDIRLAMFFAAVFGLPFSVKGGGHSAIGDSLNDGGIVVAMQSMNKITISSDQEYITVQAGATWHEVYQSLNNTNKLVVGGDCDTVGVGGYTQGGGYSVLSRLYGMAVDNLVSVSLITAAGISVTVGEHSEKQADKDLFWAVRGGGGGNWGVVTEMTFRLHESKAEKLFFARLCWPVSSATRNVIDFYSEFIYQLPHEMSIYSQFARISNQLLFCVTPTYNGPYQDGMKIVAPLLALKPQLVQIFNSTFWEYVEEVSEAESAFSTEGLSAYIKSGFISDKTTPAQLRTIFSIFLQAIMNSTSNQTILLFYHLGGKISEIPEDSNAFGHRDTNFLWELRTTWTDEVGKISSMQLSEKFGELITPFTDGGYVNQIDPYIKDWQTYYYGDHYKRLLAVKNYWDPLNFFKFNHSVGSAYRP